MDPKEGLEASASHGSSAVGPAADPARLLRRRDGHPWDDGDRVEGPVVERSVVAPAPGRPASSPASSHLHLVRRGQARRGRACNPPRSRAAPVIRRPTAARTGTRTSPNPVQERPAQRAPRAPQALTPVEPPAQDAREDPLDAGAAARAPEAGTQTSPWAVEQERQERERRGPQERPGPRLTALRPGDRLPTALRPPGRRRPPRRRPSRGGWAPGERPVPHEPRLRRASAEAGHQPGALRPAPCPRPRASPAIRD